MARAAGDAVRVARGPVVRTCQAGDGSGGGDLKRGCGAGIHHADGGRAVLVTADFFQDVPASMSDRVFARLKAEHGLDRSRVMLAFSHNHCSPRLGDDLIDYYPVDAAPDAVVARYTADCNDTCVASVGRSLAALAPATIRVVTGRAGFAQLVAEAEPPAAAGSPTVTD